LVQTIFTDVRAAIQAEFFLVEWAYALSWGALPSAGTWSMLSAYLRIIQTTTHQNMIIVSELTGSINPFLNVADVMAWELFNFSLNCILHEMLRLITILHVIFARGVDLLIKMLVLKVFLLVFECILAHWCQMALAWQRGRWLHTYAASRLPATATVLRKCHVVHFIVVLGYSTIVL